MVTIGPHLDASSPGGLPRLIPFLFVAILVAGCFGPSNPVDDLPGQPFVTCPLSEGCEGNTLIVRGEEEAPAGTMCLARSIIRDVAVTTLWNPSSDSYFVHVALTDETEGTFYRITFLVKGSETLPVALPMDSFVAVEGATRDTSIRIVEHQVAWASNSTPLRNATLDLRLVTQARFHSEDIEVEFSLDSTEWAGSFGTQYVQSCLESAGASRDLAGLRFTNH